MNPRPASLILAACASLAAGGCKPSQSNFDAGCNQAFFGAPDGSIVPSGTWTSSACGSMDLQANLAQLFGDAGACNQDSDCVFFNDAGPFTYACYTQQSTNPVNIANVPTLLGEIQGVVGGFCDLCAADGGKSYSVGVPNAFTQSQLCLQCYDGQCIANPLTDGGS